MATDNPAARTCGTCKYYRCPDPGQLRGHCVAINDEVLHWWTGCCRHELRDVDPTDPTRPSHGPILRALERGET